jgi:hypothetical protein
VLDERFTSRIPANRQTPKLIAEQLRRLGAPGTCWVVSENSRFDRTMSALDGALEVIVGQGWTSIISSIPGQLAYFEGEGPEERLLLIRRV